MSKLRIVRYGGIAAVVVALAAVMLPAWAQSSGGGRASAPSAPAGDRKLTAQLAEMRLATAKFATSLQAAEDAGYEIITQMIPNMGFHYMNPNITGFDVRKPQILVYEHHGSTYQLGALEWVFASMPQTPPLQNATFGFFPAACHYKDGTFILEEDPNNCPPTNPDTGSPFNFWHPDLFTLHVWVWYPNPAGLYAGTNPLVAPFNGG